MVVFSACVGNFINSASMNGIFRFLLAIHADVLKEALPLRVICVLVAHKPEFLAVPMWLAACCLFHPCRVVKLGRRDVFV